MTTPCDGGVQRRRFDAHCSLISPSNWTLRARPATSSVTRAGNDSVPAIVRAAIALSTACSISRCELTPTILRNLRMLKLKVSWSIGASVTTVLLATNSLFRPARAVHRVERAAASRVENVERRKLRFRAQAVPEINREAEIARPERVAGLP